MEDDSTEPSSVSPPWVIKIHCQNSADYVKLFYGGRGELTMGEDQVGSLVTEVSFLLIFPLWSTF